MYSVGLDVARDDDTVGWARSTDGTAIDDWGTATASVGTAHDGTLTVADGRSPLEHVTTGFLTRLGASEPVIVGSTPYGAEALLGAVIDGVILANTTEHGAAPDAIGLVHADGLDQFRSSLLVEAVRLAGVPPERVILVPRSAAEAAGRELDDPSGSPPGAAGAAAAACALLGDDDRRTALGAGLAAAVATAIVGTRVLEGDIATAAGAAAGPAGAPLTSGPTGTALPSGPAGTPITAGPTGAALGPTGTPSGPSGAPFAGPPGSPLPAAVKAGRPRWLPAAIVGGAAAVAVVAGVAIVAARNGDDEPPAPPAAEVAAVSEASVELAEPTGEGNAATATRESTADAVEPTTTATFTTTTTTTTSATTVASFDLAAFAGEWDTECEPFLAGDGASSGRWVFEVTGATTMSVSQAGVDYTTVDCSDPGEVIIVQGPVDVDVYGTATVEGRAAFLAMSDLYGNVAIAAEGDQLFFGIGGGGPPTAFEPQLTGTRR